MPANLFSMSLLDSVLLCTAPCEDLSSVTCTSVDNLRDMESAGQSGLERLFGFLPTFPMLPDAKIEKACLMACFVIPVLLLSIGLFKLCGGKSGKAKIAPRSECKCFSSDDKWTVERLEQLEKKVMKSIKVLKEMLEEHAHDKLL
uniref:MANEC domain-containing protein n=1 Tax=Steinernema glaseri TaxID=37863 RepID=A0A1I7Z9D7_9BILA